MISLYLESVDDSLFLSIPQLFFTAIFFIVINAKSLLDSIYRGNRSCAVGDVGSFRIPASGN
jgi:hypothetical protein